MAAHPVLTDDVIAAIARHMNDDHVDDSLLIVQTLGGRPDATNVFMSGLDGDGVIFDVTSDTERGIEVRVPWSAPIVERPQVRQEVVRMYVDACAQAGITPRQAGEH
jgi:hypothetical protein